MSKVIIVGAGPAGLTLGAELASFGISCRIFEQRSCPSIHSRAFSLFTHTLELLNMRGFAEEMIKNGLPIKISPLGDGKNVLNLRELDSQFPYILSIPQTKTEEILEKYAVICGAEIIRDARVIGLSQDNSGVTIQIKQKESVWSEQANFVVGCDGAKSTIRTLLNIQFDGMSYEQTLIHGDVHLRKPRKTFTYARTSRFGTGAVFPFKDGTFRMLLLDYESMHIPADQPITLDEFRESASRLLDMDLEIYDPLWFSRFTCQQRHAKKYRVGQVLLAGDAAHTLLPAGGQGLQVSIQDAYNLGWKLASEINGDAPPKLLDSYEFERRQIAISSMRKSSLLFRYEVSRSIYARIGRWLANKIIILFPVKKFIMNELFGLRTRYRLSNSIKNKHRLMGCRAKNFEVINLSYENGARTDLHKLLRNRKFVLVDQTTNIAFVDSIKYEYKNQIIRAIPKIKLKEFPDALLIRPDGFIAWASNRKSTAIEFKNELKRWLKSSS
uniref:RenA n=1 Tax=Candidatus Endohaliclona renieramycinifaciens TaxID=2565582 RepID=A0A4D6G3I2_9GAMM|nr:RenA [Candidatus Endohaliclona renieramycinifaciens]QCC21392.1 RenA [Candidatus Endohaliclona renieramycinifaciens]QCC21408.1 RenA [Candidatus Endohaliclona renieramycinifaciens]QCC21424.1 RenA [Candidatus Endohaliclona renieramycinifaciens]